MNRVWGNPHLLMYAGGLCLGCGGTLMLLWIFDQIEGRPLLLTAFTMTLISAYLLERGFRLLVQSHERVEALIEELHRKASTPWAD
jgi:hypothetical protein